VKESTDFNVSESDELAVADQIDTICDSFEAAWRSGVAPQIGEYLHQGDSAIRERLLSELLLVDREFRIRQGQSASREDYQLWFPEFAGTIESLEFATIVERRRASITLNTEYVGLKLGNFELLEVLGMGASGTVWKARDTQLRRLVAIKIPRHSNLSEVERERFLREGRASAQLRHPNIVAVYDVRNEGGRVFIVTEYVHGSDLKLWLESHQPAPREAANLAGLLGEALHHAHEQGVVHRDLKPANVLMSTTDASPHIADFGLAKWTTDSVAMTVEGNILGTPAYMSPEQARGNVAQVDRRSDVYALGALLYEMLTGRPPFQGDVAAIVHQVIHDEPVPPRKLNPDIARDLETICLKSMEKIPERRYATAQEMAVDLRRFLRGDAILARRVGPVERTWRKCKRRPAMILASVLLAVACVGTFVLASVSSERDRLAGEKSRLEGFQQTRFTTNPPGARLTLVPIDQATGEPVDDPAQILRPEGVTPLTIGVKPGEYAVEAVRPVAGSEIQDFAEVRRTVPHPNTMPFTTPNLDWTFDPDTEVVSLREIRILPTANVLSRMVRVPVPDIDRKNHPQLPNALWADVRETAPDDLRDSEGLESPWVTKMANDSNGVLFDQAVGYLERQGARLPSDIEYEVIQKFLDQQRFFTKGKPPIHGLDGGVAEWTTTKYRSVGDAEFDQSLLSDLMLLRGYGVTEDFSDLPRTTLQQLCYPRVHLSPLVGFRGVRSERPRFASP
jgi:tRNA A-37 threonylcarbamoyl transferase component Bud32